MPTESELNRETVIDALNRLPRTLDSCGTDDELTVIAKTGRKMNELQSKLFIELINSCPDNQLVAFMTEKAELDQEIKSLFAEVVKGKMKVELCIEAATNVRNGVNWFVQVQDNEIDELSKRITAMKEATGPKTEPDAEKKEEIPF